jgi:hypothetical protein
MVSHCHGLEGMWKEAFMAYLPGICQKELRENKKTPTHDSLCRGGDLKPILSESSLQLYSFVSNIIKKRAKLYGLTLLLIYNKIFYNFMLVFLSWPIYCLYQPRIRFSGSPDLTLIIRLPDEGL